MNQIPLLDLVHARIQSGVSCLVSTCGGAEAHPLSCYSIFEDDYRNVRCKELNRLSICHFCMSSCHSSMMTRRKDRACYKWIMNGERVVLVQTVIKNSCLSVVGMNHWCRNKKNRASTDTLPLLNASTEACNNEFQTHTKLFSIILCKRLENNTRPQKSSRTWFLVDALRKDNKLMALERLQYEDGHATLKKTVRQKDFHSKKVAMDVNDNCWVCRKYLN